ncbi:hypothetical protein [Pseudalkalibacillus sp. SCS-8]|uniref:hypothetical protein n=1 Tax=Pseudalkalibacillus nanhaiensis TaxID=3115291 RepID=UPI0032DA05F0
MPAKEMDTFKWELNRITRNFTELVHSYEKLDQGEKEYVHHNYPFTSELPELKNLVAKWNDSISSNK